MELSSPERLESTRPNRDIIKSKSIEKAFCGESKNKILKMSILDLDGSAVLPHLH